MTRVEARKVIRQASAITIDRLYEHFGSEKVENANIYFDIQSVLFAARGRPGNPNYDRKEFFIPKTIPHDIFEEAMRTITDKMLVTGITMGMKDRGLA